jgi:hypothetical protein
MCRTSTPDDKICDQCKRHGLECVYLPHTRGRKLGSRNRKRGSSSDVGRPSGSALDMSIDPAIYRSQSSSTRVGGQLSEQQYSRRPVTIMETEHTQRSTTQTVSYAANMPNPLPVLPFLGTASVPANAPRHASDQTMVEQSPLALLARTAESRSKSKCEAPILHTAHADLCASSCQTTALTLGRREYPIRKNSTDIVSRPTCHLGGRHGVDTPAN